MIIMGDFSNTKKVILKKYYWKITEQYVDISNIHKNHEDETFYGILIKDSYVPILSVYEKC